MINLTLEFDAPVAPREIPEIIAAIRYAHARGVVVVAAAGNTGTKYLRRVAYPARASDVIAVGGDHAPRLPADYSNFGVDLDIVAPGGGVDADPARPEDVGALPARGVRRLDLPADLHRASVRSFGLPGGYEGTSMASPHVSAVAALMIATGKLGANPSPSAVAGAHRGTARDLGRPGFDRATARAWSTRRARCAARRSPPAEPARWSG